MNETLVSIDDAGRVTLPKSVCQELAIHPGDILKISVRGQEVSLSPDKVPPGFVRKGTALVFSGDVGHVMETEKVESILAEEREQREATLLNQSPLIHSKE